LNRLECKEPSIIPKTAWRDDCPLHMDKIVKRETEMGKVKKDERTQE